jgi:hypothetical protein
MRKISVAAEGGDVVGLGGAAGGDVAGGESHGGEQKDHGGEGGRISGRRAEEHGADGAGDGEGRDGAEGDGDQGSAPPNFLCSCGDWRTSSDKARGFRARMQCAVPTLASTLRQDFQRDEVPAFSSGKPQTRIRSWHLAGRSCRQTTCK